MYLVLLVAAMTFLLVLFPIFQGGGSALAVSKVSMRYSNDDNESDAVPAVDENARTRVRFADAEAVVASRASSVESDDSFCTVPPPPEPALPYADHASMTGVWRLYTRLAVLRSTKGVWVRDLL